mgnify:FL=1|tara:strand:- start:1304 stop:1918 length:615 start_codon:yes stop_codon:yes gene_type:complete
MVKKCPPGIICFENVTFILLFIIIVITLIYMISYFSYFKNSSQIVVQRETAPHTHVRPNYGYTNLPPTHDTLGDPYAPPLKDERFLVAARDIRGYIPVNVPTQGVDETYRQVGILTPVSGANGSTILPLMGRPLITNRDKWQYYCINDKERGIKLPLSHNGRSCTNEYGCDNLYNGDTVYIEGYNDTFKVTVYDNAPMRYIPFI